MRRVLVVDDDADLRALARHVLEIAGFEPTLVANGDEALAALRRERPDLVLLDIQMPISDGWSTLAAIRSEPSTAELPVVLATVKALPHDQRRGWAAGCDGYITKPYAIADLGPSLERVLERDPAERADHRLEQLARLTDGEQPDRDRRSLLRVPTRGGAAD